MKSSRDNFTVLNVNFLEDLKYSQNSSTILTRVASLASILVKVWGIGPIVCVTVFLKYPVILGIMWVDNVCSLVYLRCKSQILSQHEFVSYKNR